MSTYISSDFHFGHQNILLYSARPFSSTEEMNAAMIERHNAIVKPTDDFYHLGDFAYGSGLNNPGKYFNQLNGHKHLIIGNHDEGKTLQLPWASKQHYKEIKICDQRIVLFHYAMRVWHHGYKGTWNLWGHSHGTLMEKDILSFDMGVDIWNYTPVSFEQLKAKMDFKKANPMYFTNLFADIEDKEISNKQMEVQRRIREVNKQFWV